MLVGKKVYLEDIGLLKRISLWGNSQNKWLVMKTFTLQELNKNYTKVRSLVFWYSTLFMLVSSADFFSKLTFSMDSNHFIRVSNRLDLGPNCLQRLSALEKVTSSKERV